MNPRLVCYPLGYRFESYSGRLSDTSESFLSYILEDPSGRFNVGHTEEIERRLLEHNADEKIGTKHTHKHLPWRLV